MMPVRTMRENREVFLGRIEPIMHELIVIWNTAELSGRAFGVVEGMCHVRAPRVRWSQTRYSGSSG